MENPTEHTDTVESSIEDTSFIYSDSDDSNLLSTTEESYYCSCDSDSSTSMIAEDTEVPAKVKSLFGSDRLSDSVSDDDDDDWLSTRRILITVPAIWKAPMSMIKEKKTKSMKHSTRQKIWYCVLNVRIYDLKKLNNCGRLSWFRWKTDLQSY